MLHYEHLVGEDYEDDAADGVMLRFSCPCCELELNTLVPYDYYQEMLQASFLGEERG
ncbi:MAG: hypothetical protein HQL49_08745 [Gammaproteobacteria bacterium]|nr:hypothetical protein [Gammaproteobacteria bacterium]